ncbi:MAG TPA: GNAT family N-acetyltransferase [Trueperaceae bacterium]
MATASLTLRPARPSDASEVTRLLSGIYREERYFVGDGPSSSTSLAARIGVDDPQRSLYLVAARGTGVVGWCELHRSPAWRLEHVAVLTLAVSPTERRHGVGRALLSEAYDWCRRVGVLKVSLQVRAGNEAAIALYRSEGFALEGREVGQVRLERGGPFEDNLIMGKWLGGRARSEEGAA